jgi:phage-related tail protein
MAPFFKEEKMARSQLNRAAKKIGAAMGRADRTAHKAAKKIGAAMDRADRTAHKVAKAGVVAKQELVELSKQVESLKRQIQKTTKRLKHALS